MIRRVPRQNVVQKSSFNSNICKKLLMAIKKVQVVVKKGSTLPRLLTTPFSYCYISILCHVQRRSSFIKWHGNNRVPVQIHQVTWEQQSSCPNSSSDMGTTEFLSKFIKWHGKSRVPVRIHQVTWEQQSSCPNSSSAMGTEFLSKFDSNFLLFKQFNNTIYKEM